MKTKIEKLQDLIKTTRGNIKTSLIELLKYGKTKTGKSGYSKGWASKSVWTSDVRIILRNAKIQFESGNTAPKGGANGEFIQLTDKTLLSQIKKRNEEILKEKLHQIESAEREKQKRIEALNTFINSLPLNEQFEQKFLSTELKNESGLSWNAYRESLKEQFPEEWKILKEKFKAKKDLFV